MRGVPVGVILDKESVGFIVAILSHKKSGGLRKEENNTGDQGRTHHLYPERKAPVKVGVGDVLVGSVDG